ncbi:SDR family oxidoreductase [Protaetiibacter mangrovi]|uniref:SDR family oxidoreductase n=1 Tax=Protaetiibacter mangrovi TaxID=2970926 RepID=A0ABT1ZFV0_9MICO|nr:SDR family oxidoreductase [Protaetiibacter mangrovi]MCS0499556.1 SDR family oxidoreductase [Protaetiibacter mangrovi]TPX03771.1 SDR family oxidoreductase [Schumannella luteola]
MRRFDGKLALITAASRGIGFAIAERLVAEGARVVITARKEEPLRAAAARLGDAAEWVAGRADDPEHRAEVFSRIRERHAGLDLLVNNVGINPVYGPVLEVDPAAARKILEVNVVGALEWTRDAVAAGLAERQGSIVNVSSIAGTGPSPGIAFYGVSKAALINLTQQLASELAPAVRVNAVAPAIIKTDFAKALYDGREAEVAAQFPLGRLGVPADVAGPVAFLLSDDAAWITGRTIVIDGGGSLRPIG